MTAAGRGAVVGAQVHHTGGEDSVEYVGLDDSVLTLRQELGETLPLIETAGRPRRRGCPAVGG
jgi:hypothetical protein